MDHDDIQSAVMDTIGGVCTRCMEGGIQKVVTDIETAAEPGIEDTHSVHFLASRR